PGKQISSDAKFQVDFVEPEFPKSADEKAKEFNFLQLHNAKTDIDLIMEMNPDLNEDEAKEELAKNKVINDANRPQIGINPVQQPGGANAFKNQSGFSLMIQNFGKLEARGGQVPMYNMGENETFLKERIIWNKHNPGKQISSDAKFQVDFVEPEFPKSADEKAKEFNFLQLHNAKTDIDLIMEMNPDLNEDEAKEELAKNKVINDANRPQIGINPVQQPGGANAFKNQSGFSLMIQNFGKL
ncbi:unnamed protein product, partial [marine sediment metagenome]